MKTCFMFGHATTPDIYERLVLALEEVYEVYGIRRFVVGSRGLFDCVEAVKGLRYMKSKYSDLEVCRLLAYHPAWNRPETRIISDVFDCTYYPAGMENVPAALCIRKANEIMVKEADCVICYVSHPGNARNLLEFAKKKHVSCINLAENVSIDDG